MMKFLRPGLIIACLSLASIAQADFVNGSFETGDVTGWVSNSPYGLNPFGTTYGSGMDGTYWHWLAGYEINITTYQTLTGLTPGTTYDVSFIMASETSHADSLRVSVDGGSGTIFTAPNGNLWDTWVRQHYQFTASGTSATVQFDTIGLNGGGFDVGLDDVHLSVASVPEPGSIGLLLTVVVALAFGTKRQRQGSTSTAS